MLILVSQLLNEIMPMIYKRFTEKSAEEWRQIYKVPSVRFGTFYPASSNISIVGAPASRISDQKRVGASD